MSTPTPERRPVAALAPKTSRLDYKDVLLRAAFFLSVLGSLALVWWSVKRLTPLQDKSRDLSTQLARLSTEVDQMKMDLTSPDVEQLARKYVQVQGQLFGGQSALETWLQGLRRQTLPLALDVKADFGKAAAQAAGEQKLAVIPATVSVEVRPAAGIEGVQSPYQRVLQLSQRLTAEEKRADLVELNVAGGTNSVSRAVVVLNLWAGQEGQQ